MPNTYFKFKQFAIHQDQCAMKVTTDACLFGAWVAAMVMNASSNSEEYALDIGSGTGLLSLMLAQKNPGLLIDALEIDDAAVTQSLENVNASPWHAAIKVWQGDAKKISPQLGRHYNFIVSNPPFYENDLTASDHKRNIAHHNTGLKLDEVLDLIENSLEKNGTFFLLLAYKRTVEIERLLGARKLSIFHKVMVRQSTGHDFFRVMIAGSRQVYGSGNAILEELAIWDDNKQYTPAFNTLLKDYYLYL